VFPPTIQRYCCGTGLTLARIHEAVGPSTMSGGGHATQTARVDTGAVGRGNGGRAELFAWSWRRPASDTSDAFDNDREADRAQIRFALRAPGLRVESS